LASLLRDKIGGQSSRQADPLKLAGVQTDWPAVKVRGKQIRRSWLMARPKGFTL